MPHATNGAANGATNGTYRRGPNGLAQVPIGVESGAHGDQKTDYTRWRLKDVRGCQTWHYLQSEEEIKEWPQSAVDRYFLGLETVRTILAESYCLRKKDNDQVARIWSDLELLGTPPTPKRKDTTRSRRKRTLLLLESPATAW